MIGFDKNKIVKAEDLGVFITMVAKETKKKEGEYGRSVDYKTEEPMIGLVFYNKENHSVCPVASYFAGNPVWYEVRRYKYYTENYKGEKVAIEDWRCGTETGFPLLDPTTKNPFEYLVDMKTLVKEHRVRTNKKVIEQKANLVASFIEENFPKLLQGMPMLEFRDMYSKFLATQLNEYALGSKYQTANNPNNYYKPEPTLSNNPDHFFAIKKYSDIDMYDLDNLVEILIPKTTCKVNTGENIVKREIAVSSVEYNRFVGLGANIDSDYDCSSNIGQRSSKYVRHYFEKFFSQSEQEGKVLTLEEMYRKNEEFMAFQMASLLHGEYFHKKERDVKPLLGNANHTGTFVEVKSKENTEIQQSKNNNQDLVIYESDLALIDLGYDWQLAFMDNYTETICPVFAYYAGQPVFYRATPDQFVSCASKEPNTVFKLGHRCNAIPFSSKGFKYLDLLPKSLYRYNCKYDDAGNIIEKNIESCCKTPEEERWFDLVVNKLPVLLKQGIKASDFKKIHKQFVNIHEIGYDYEDKYYDVRVVGKNNYKDILNKQSFTKKDDYCYIRRPIVKDLLTTMDLEIAPTPKRFQVAKEQTIEKE